MEVSERGRKKADKQCWECLKRRLVCDHTLPHCGKCQAAGRKCPGYGEQKPLQWVQIGKITSRRSKKEAGKRLYLTSQPHIDPLPAGTFHPSYSQSLLNGKAYKIPDEISLSLPSDADDIEGLAYWRTVMSAGWTAFRERPHDATKDQHHSIMTELFTAQAAIAEDIELMLQAGGQARLEQIVRRGLYSEAAKLLRTHRQPLNKLEGLLKFMRSEGLPNYDFLSSETSEVVQAVQYYNSRIHPGVVASGELAPNPAIRSFPLNALHVLPPTVHHTLVCMSINHFIHSLPIEANKDIIRSNQLNVLRHRIAAIQSLRHYIGQDQTKCSDITIASILMFMSVELQSAVPTDWRSHAMAMQRIVDLRGGFKDLLKQAPFLAPTLVIYILVITMANACSPASDQVQTSKQICDDIVADYTDLYDLIFPYTLCPPEIFTAILKINELRAKASPQRLQSDGSEFELIPEAQDVLDSILTFRADDWAQRGAHYSDWHIIGTMYQAAVAVYCIMSLQSLAVLPRTLEMNAIRVEYGDILFGSLLRGSGIPRIAKFLAWPLIVAGVEAAYRGEGIKNWIEATLEHLSRSLGTSSPLKARTVLRRYWKKGEPGWEECFDRPEIALLACGIC
ncbi:hypothetical protein NX059_005963 [Plenodomus lindquistii]|nr:hypothetical protein NX059_005963 [Plenodomus lindquistii]